MRTLRSQPRPRYVEIDESRCNGCVLCMKACPTAAIRVEQNRLARILGPCIDCSECVRVCPRGAVKAVTMEQIDFQACAHPIVSSSAVLYAQFGPQVLPNDVLLALRRMGFQYVHDEAYTNEIFNVAVEIFIKEQRGRREAPWPLISPVCPVVVQLIRHRFPSLLKHIPPLLTPREIVAREAKRRLSVKFGCRLEDLTVFHVTPCPAKLMSIEEPLLQERSYMDFIIGINRIYDEVKRHINDLEEDKVLHHSGGIGLGWGVSGGEIAGVDADCMAVSGLQETIRYLEKIEMGALRDIEYVEFRTCKEGCLGGPLTVVDKYLAKRHVERLVRMFGVERHVKFDYVRKLYEQGWFLTDRPEVLPVPGREKDLNRRIAWLNLVEQTLKGLPGKDCGVCGAPDCKTFAEDVVDGMATLEECLFVTEHGGLETYKEEGR